MNVYISYMKDKLNFTSNFSDQNHSKSKFQGKIELIY